MHIYGLAYHDVVPAINRDSSGFPGAMAARYKISPEILHSHFESFARTLSNPPSTIHNLKCGNGNNASCLLTFDDGGVSAYERTADILENYGWYGHFFIITDFIGKPGYLSKEHIRHLRMRGHVIGSHTCSHIYPIAFQSIRMQQREWRASLDALSDILGERVESGAFPGGSYSKTAAAEASRAGVRFLFTLEPRNKPWMVEDCLVIGRYLIRSKTTTSKATAFARGLSLPCNSQRLLWNVRKLPKRLCGKYYEQAKAMLFDQSTS